MLVMFAKCVALRTSDLDALVALITPRVAFIEANTNRGYYRSSIKIGEKN